jgi:hypothetical protein
MALGEDPAASVDGVISISPTGISVILIDAPFLKKPVSFVVFTSKKIFPASSFPNRCDTILRDIIVEFPTEHPLSGIVKTIICPDRFIGAVATMLLHEIPNIPDRGTTVGLLPATHKGRDAIRVTSSNPESAPLVDVVIENVMSVRAFPEIVSLNCTSRSAGPKSVV